MKLQTVKLGSPRAMEAEPSLDPPDDPEYTCPKCGSHERSITNDYLNFKLRVRCVECGYTEKYDTFCY